MATRSLPRRKAKQRPSANQGDELLDQLPPAERVRLGATMRAQTPARLPSRKTIAARGFELGHRLYGASRILKTLKLVCDSDILGDDSESEINGIGEALGFVIDIVDSVANDVDSVALLAPDARS